MYPEISAAEYLEYVWVFKFLFGVRSFIFFEGDNIYFYLRFVGVSALFLIQLVHGGYMLFIIFGFKPSFAHIEC